MEEVTIALSFAGAFALGTIFSVLGAVKLHLAPALGVDDAQYGRLISALMFTSMIAVLVIGPLQDAIGFAPIAVIAFIASGVCLWLLAAVKNYKVALFASALLGVGAMCASVTGSSLGPTVLFDGENPAVAQNVINVFFGIGAFLTPYLVGKLMNNLGYQKTVSIIGAIVFVPIILVFFSAFPETPEGFDIGGTLGLVATPYIIFGGLALFCYVGLEITMAGFVSTYLKDHELTVEQANKWLAGFWVALIVGRILASVLLLATDLPPAQQAPIAPLLGLLAVGSILIMVTAKTAKAGITGTLLTGLIFGPIFPMLVGVTQFKSASIQAGIAGSVFSWIFALGLLGGTLIPMLIGKLSAESTIRQSMKTAVMVAVALVILSGILWIVPAADPAEILDRVAMMAAQ